MITWPSLNIKNINNFQVENEAPPNANEPVEIIDNRNSSSPVTEPVKPPVTSVQTEHVIQNILNTRRMMSDSFPAGIPGLMSQFNPLMSAQANPAALHLSQFQHLQRLQANQRILGNKFKTSIRNYYSSNKNHRKNLWIPFDCKSNFRVVKFCWREFLK